MKYLFVLLFSVAVVADESPYSSIIKRNAFGLTEGLPPASEILNKIEIPKIKLFLTGVTRLRGETKAHMYSKDLPNKYLSLRVGEQSGPVRVLSISRDVVKVVNDGDEETLSFLDNSIPSIFTGKKGKATVVKKDSRESSRSRSSRDRESKKPTTSSPTRVESLQSGQHQIKSNIDQNERRRQYDEWRKRRDQ